MDDRPEDPGWKAGHPPTAEIEKRGVAADDPGIAAVAVAERRERRPSLEVSAQRAADMVALLLGDLSQRRQWPACMAVAEIGRAHVCTPDTNAHLVFRLL